MYQSTKSKTMNLCELLKVSRGHINNVAIIKGEGN